ncbi:MAG TPA: hypothetical protein VNX70_03225 [Bryobacteraceae bacterium]|nr:hypothetical protein [Bryobacteraceae bacterium]
MKIAVLASAFAVLAAAQFPGQYPPGQYPPGQYPPGQGPGGGSGIPMPRRGSQKSTDQKQQQTAVQPRSFSGVIRELTDKSFDLETTDTRILTIQLTDKTTKPDGLKTGDGVDVEATQSADGPFQAVSIKANPAMARKIIPSGQGQVDAEPEEERTGPPPTILVRPDQNPGDDAPKLKRGKPAEYATNKRPSDDDSSNAPDVRPATREPIRREPPPPPINPRQAFIAKARDVASTFVEGLPNYVCQEMTTRYASETRVPSWNVIDIVSAEVVYENGKESYRNLMINNKPTKKPPEESGAWSTGEFGTILANLFSPAADAAFKYAQDDTISHIAASVYDFQVTRQRSSWKIWVPGQYILPAYKGSVWIDKQSAHALRIEMQAKDIPEEFPRISVETAVDFDYITLGTPEKFLLPVHAEVLSCSRGSNECDRNVIEFRNYHKFTGESVIKFNQ